ncbi:MAG: hypothetical protein KQ78_01854 [Candidatus Izimaplasma bacterium HR2]|nr:MAG: hypothetical protein KQ78_01854 [Candidatus Izimaplasma bacterium HR2]
MGDYFDRYKERINILGNTFAEKMDKDAKEVYERYMFDKGTDTAVINLNEYRISKINDKDNETVEQYIILADRNSPFTTGTVFEIDCVFYIVIYEVQTEHNQYFKGYARRCTHSLKIKTEAGVYLYDAYIEGINGVNMKRTVTEGLIVDDDQASGKVIIQKDSYFRYIKPLKTRIFIGDEVYKIVGKNSLQDMGYLRVEKDIINTFTDNKVLGIADYYEDVEIEHNFYISATTVSGIALGLDTEYEIEDILDIQIKNYEGEFVPMAYTLNAIATEININGSKITPLVLGNLKLYITLDEDVNSRAEVVLEVLNDDILNYTMTGEDTLVWSESSIYEITKFISDVEVPST